MKSQLARILVGGALLALASCATTEATTPAEIAEAQVSALRARDHVTAWRLLSEGGRARNLPMPEPGALPTGHAREVERVARWATPEGPLVLVRDGNGWRLRAGVLGLSRASTPAQALETLARAIDARDFDLMLSLLPMEERTRWTARELAAALESPAVASAWRALAARIRGEAPTLAWLDAGTRVRAAWGADVAVVLAREEDGWKILDVEPRRPYTGAP